MANYRVKLVTGETYDVVADSFQATGSGALQFMNLITVQDAGRHYQYGAQSYREKYDAVAYFTGVAAVTIKDK